jgi:hypothetical protein
MIEDQGRALMRQVLWSCVGLMAGVSAVALGLRLRALATGYLSGMAIGLLSVGSIVYLVYHVIAPRVPQGSQIRQRAAGVVLALGKYLLIAALLYVSLVYLRVYPWALVAGLATPTLVTCVVALLISRQAPAPSE